jgi:hypothetical protein
MPKCWWNPKVLPAAGIASGFHCGGFALIEPELIPSKRHGRTLTSWHI